jgi:hypothetical protein
MGSTGSKNSGQITKLQTAADKKVTNGVTFATFFRTVAILVVLALIAWTILVSVFTKNRFFPKTPTNTNLMLKAIREYKPELPKTL